MAREYSSMYIQALDILSSMGLTPQPTAEGSSMYVFKYKYLTMFLDEGEERNDIDLSCSVYLSGTEEEQKQLLEDARDMADLDLKDYDIYYIGEGLACISLFLRMKETRHKLYRKHLLSMLDRLHEGYFTLMCAISLISYTETPEFISSILNDKDRTL